MEGNLNQEQVPTSQNEKDDSLIDISSNKTENTYQINETNQSEIDKPKKKFNIALMIVITIIIISILAFGFWFILGKLSKTNFKLFTDNSNQKTNSSTNASTIQTGGNTQVFETFVYNDPASSLDAFKLLVPEGWKTEGKITWSPKVFLPAVSDFRFYNPSGDSQEFDIFPTVDYFSTNNQLTQAYYPAGSLYFNTIIKDPIGLHEAFNEIINTHRSGITNMQIIEEKPVPELAEIAKGSPVSGVNSQAEAGKMRFTYKENGKDMEEEMYAVVSQFIVNYPASLLTNEYFTNNWYIDYIFSFRAEKDKLDANSKTFQTMINSVVVDKKWYAKLVNVKEDLAKMNMDQIKAIGQMGQMIANAGSEMRADQMQSWEYRQQSQDRISENFSDNILGIDRYIDPANGGEVELPSGYKNAWANSTGDYIVSDSLDYNPNINSNQNWSELELKK